MPTTGVHAPAARNSSPALCLSFSVLARWPQRVDFLLAVAQSPQHGDERTLLFLGEKIYIIAPQRLQPLRRSHGFEQQGAHMHLFNMLAKPSPCMVKQSIENRCSLPRRGLEKTFKQFWRRPRP